MRRALRAAAPLFVAALLSCPLPALRADDPAAPKAPAVSRCDLARQVKVWSCDACRAFFEDAQLKEGACPGCAAAPQQVLVCEKVAYECEKDRIQAWEAGKCPKCDGALATRKVFGPLFYKCSQCEHMGNPGTACPTHNEMLHRDCLTAGTYPHLKKPEDGKPLEKPDEPKGQGK